MCERALTYFFTLQSPWSYLGHAVFVDLLERHGLGIVWKPMSLPDVFPQSGGLPLAKRHPKRQAYRDIDLQRWRVRRGLPLNLRPRFWPTDIGLADRTVIALAEDGRNPDGFVRRAFAALWGEERNLAEESTIAALLDDTAANRTALDKAASAEAAAIYEANTREALDAGVFGAPTYVLGGEPFWGQDRLDLLDEALTGGRAPITTS